MTKTEYKIIKTEKELHSFLNEFDCFHDSCIKEIHYITGRSPGRGRSFYMG